MVSRTLLLNIPTSLKSGTDKSDTKHFQLVKDMGQQTTTIPLGWLNFLTSDEFNLQKSINNLTVERFICNLLRRNVEPFEKVQVSSSFKNKHLKKKNNVCKQYNPCIFIVLSGDMEINTRVDLTLSVTQNIFPIHRMPSKG